MTEEEKEEIQKSIIILWSIDPRTKGYPKEAINIFSKRMASKYKLKDEKNRIEGSLYIITDNEEYKNYKECMIYYFGSK